MAITQQDIMDNPGAYTIGVELDGKRYPGYIKGVKRAFPAICARLSPLQWLEAEFSWQTIIRLANSPVPTLDGNNLSKVNY